MNFTRAVRKIRACEGETAAQLLLENYLKTYDASLKTNAGFESNSTELLTARQLLRNWLDSANFDPYEIVGNDEFGHPLNKIGALRRKTIEFLQGG